MDKEELKLLLKECLSIEVNEEPVMGAISKVGITIKFDDEKICYGDYLIEKYK